MPEIDIPRFKLAKDQEIKIMNTILQLGAKTLPKYWIIYNYFYDDLKEEEE